MLVSYKKQFIFTHIPKTAGTSIKWALRKYRSTTEQHRLLRFVARHNPFCEFVNYSAHPHWSLYRAKCLLGDEVFERFYKFASVRHPVSREISIFKYLLKHEGRTNLKRDVFTPVFKYRKFDQFIRWRRDTGAVPQITQLINDRGEILTDDIIRIEAIETEFARVCERIGISKSLPVLNDNPLKTKDIEVTKSTSRIIEMLFQADYEAFGYTSPCGLGKREMSQDKCYLKEGRLLSEIETAHNGRFGPMVVYC